MAKWRRKQKGPLSWTLDIPEWAGMRTLVAAFNAMGERSAVALAATAGRAAYRLGLRLRVVKENLKTAFGGEMSAEGLEELARKSYVQWGVTVAEWARAWGRGLEGALDRVEIEGDGPIVKALGRGRGAIIVTAHFGHFELMPLAWARRHGPLHLVVRPLDNRLLETTLTRLRSRYGCRVLPRKGIVREAIRSLRAGNMLGVLIDQNMIYREGVFVDFLGRPACTTPLPALLALRTGAAVFPGFIFREAPFRHRLVFGPEIPRIETGDLRADLEANTAQYTQAVEEAVRAHPDLWLWGHRRWRTRPVPGRGPAPARRPARATTGPLGQSGASRL